MALPQVVTPLNSLQYNMRPVCESAMLLRSCSAMSGTRIACVLRCAAQYCEGVRVLSTERAYRRIWLSTASTPASPISYLPTPIHTPHDATAIVYRAITHPVSPYP
eukprot:3939058-Rhodomonas_salina.1